ncbi:hypothetical protein IAT38_007679 [Cryptococcus sp. DSM 104549]
MIASTSIKAFLVATLFSLPYAYAASPWVGCLLTASATSASSSRSRTSGSGTCITACASAGAQYASFVPGILIGNNCFCINEGSYPNSVGYAAPSTSLEAVCVPILQASTYVVSSTYTYDGCYAPSGLISPIINAATGNLGHTVSSPRACFTRCASTQAAYVVPYLTLTGSPRYGCACGDETTVSGIPTVCGLGLFYRYNHPAGAAASSLPRKKRENARVMAMKRAQMVKERAWDCPTGMKACNVDGAQDSWECVDPARDLESCGGCTYGDFVRGAVNLTEPTGFDCTTIPGILRGSVTCSDGRCTAFACKRGWTLSNGECLKSMTLQV